MAINCIPRIRLKEYLSGWTDAEQSEAIESHLSTCADCEQTIAALESDPETLVDFVRNLPHLPPISGPSAVDSAVVYAFSRAKKLSNDSSASASFPTGQSDVKLKSSGELGPYELLKPLGQGGMASVYLARHRQLGKQVAIKLLPERSFRNDHYAARFQREIRTAGQLNHPAIVSATDAGEHQGTHYLVMEYIDGMDLSRVAKAMGEFSVADACEIIRIVALGLSHAHAAGVVHRDIKPSNLMLSASGEIKILDFGLAQVSLWDEASAELTTVGQLMGTLDYMAPEQAERADAVDYRADLYSLGATLFRLLCGRAPLAAAPDLSPLAKLRLLATHQPPRLDTLRSDAPPQLVEFVGQLLARNPIDRPASAAHVAEQLSEFTSCSDLKALITTAQAKSHSAKEEASDCKVRRAGGSMLHHPTKPSDVANNASNAGPRSFIPRWLVATALLSFFVFGGVMITLETQKGQLIIESESANVEVKLLKEGQPVYDRVQVSPGVNSTRLYAGKYEVTLSEGSDGFVLDSDRIEVLKGQTVIARIKTVPKEGSSIIQGTTVEATLALTPPSSTKISSGDLIAILSLSDESLNTRTVVMDDETIKLPWIGTVSVRGQSVQSLREMLKQQYQSLFCCKEPAIDVYLGDYNQPLEARFFVDTLPPAGSLRPGGPQASNSEIQPGDMLLLRCFNGELSQVNIRVIVLADRTITLPMIGTITLDAGSNLQLLEQRIRSLYAQYIKEPVIGVYRCIPPKSNTVLASNNKIVAPTYAREPSESEPIYDGKTLTEWLELFERERSPNEFMKTRSAISALITDSTANKVERALLSTLPKMPSKISGMVGSVDTLSFGLLRQCKRSSQEYAELMVDQLKSTDKSWVKRVLQCGPSGAESPDEMQLYRKWIQENVLTKGQSTAHSEDPDLVKAALSLYEVAIRGFQLEDAKPLLDDLLQSPVVTSSFWLEPAFSEVQNPMSLKINAKDHAVRALIAHTIESKAVNALLTPTTPDELVIRSVLLLKLFQSSHFDRDGMSPTPRLPDLKQWIELRVVQLASDPVELTRMTGYKSWPYWYLAPAPDLALDVKALALVLHVCFVPRLQRTEIVGQPTDGVTSFSIELLQLAEAFRMESALKPALKEILNTTSGPTYQLAAKTTNPFRNRIASVGYTWPRMEVSLDKSGADQRLKLDAPTSNEVLNCLIFTKALTMLPKKDRAEAITVHSEALFTHWLGVLADRLDQNGDGKLEYSEVADELGEPKYFDKSGTPERVDTNHDGVISIDELQVFAKEPNDKSADTPMVDALKPQASKTNQGENPQEPIYEGKYLSDWLELFSRERSPIELGKALMAIEALVSTDTAGQVKKALLENLPKMTNQKVKLVNSEYSIDRIALPILRQCYSNNRDYIIELVTQLSRDQAWAKRVLDPSSIMQLALTMQDFEPFHQWIQANILQSDNRVELRSSVWAFYRYILLRNKTRFSDGDIQRISQDLATSKRVDPDFWLATIPELSSNAPRDFVEWPSAFATAAESQAVDVLKDDNAPGHLLLRATILLGVLNSKGYNRSGMPELQLTKVANALRKRLSSMVSDRGKTIESAETDWQFPAVKGPYFYAEVSTSLKLVPRVYVYLASQSRESNLCLRLIELASTLELGEELKPELTELVQANSVEAHALIRKMTKPLGSDSEMLLQTQWNELSLRWTEMGTSRQFHIEGAKDDLLRCLIYDAALRTMSTDQQKSIIDSEFQLFQQRWVDEVLAELDKDRDGKLAESEFKDGPLVQESVDSNGDHSITSEEMMAVIKRSANGRATRL